MATENMPPITVKLHIVDYSRQLISASLNGSPRNLHTSFTWANAKPYFRKLFSHTPKIWRFTTNYRESADNQKRVTSKRLNM